MIGLRFLPVFVDVVFAILVLCGSKAACGAASGYTFSTQVAALAPNAGGQDAYGLRLSRDDTWELGIFSNQYLLTGAVPLSGVLLDYRLPICGRWCPLRSFVQFGGGFTNAGPVVEVLWNFSPLWLIRIDFASHFYFLPGRIVTWSYPLWIGASVPF